MFSAVLHPLYFFGKMPVPFVAYNRYSLIKLGFDNSWKFTVRYGKEKRNVSGCIAFWKQKAAEEYLDELWAEKAVSGFNKSKPGKLYSLDEVKEKLGQKKQRSNSKPDSKIQVKKKKVKA